MSPFLAEKTPAATAKNTWRVFPIFHGYSIDTCGLSMDNPEISVDYQWILHTYPWIIFMNNSEISMEYPCIVSTLVLDVSKLFGNHWDTFNSCLNNLLDICWWSWGIFGVTWGSSEGNQRSFLKSNLLWGDPGSTCFEYLSLFGAPRDVTWGGCGWRWVGSGVVTDVTSNQF